MAISNTACNRITLLSTKGRRVFYFFNIVYFRYILL
nr:MAG TPA: hypothetical protein [Caudoviricetes sp.]